MRRITHEEAQALLRVEAPIVVTRLPSGKYVDSEGDKVDPKQAEPWVHDERCDVVYTELEARALIATASVLHVGEGKCGRTLWVSENRFGDRFRAVEIPAANVRRSKVAILRGAKPTDCQEGLDGLPDMWVEICVLGDGRIRAATKEADGFGATVQDALAALADALESVEDEP